MSYTIDVSRYAYHRVIGSQDIFVCTYDTPDEYLLKGYLGPIGIPYHDENDDDDLEGDEAIPSGILTSSNHALTIDPSAPCLAHHHRPSTSSSSIDTYTQQITTSLAVMDGCLTKIQQEVHHQIAQINALYQRMDCSSTGSNQHSA